MSVTHLIIRPSGPHSAVELQGCRVVETSLDHLVIKASARAALLGAKLGSIVLEDMHAHELPKIVADTLSAGRFGVSCPMVSRWTYPRDGDAR